jgi:hypothetical protein
MFHKSNLGRFGEHLPADMEGYVPALEDGPWDLNVDHSSERTHNDDGSLTDYGKWWEETGFPEWVADAARQTKRCDEYLSECRSSGK